MRRAFGQAAVPSDLQLWLRWKPIQLFSVEAGKLKDMAGPLQGAQIGEVSAVVWWFRRALDLDQEMPHPLFQAEGLQVFAHRRRQPRAAPLPQPTGRGQWPPRMELALAIGVRLSHLQAIEGGVLRLRQEKRRHAPPAGLREGSIDLLLSDRVSPEVRNDPRKHQGILHFPKVGRGRIDLPDRPQTLAGTAEVALVVVGR
jgi:hypothetical protein